MAVFNIEKVDRVNTMNIQIASPAFWGNEKKYVNDCIDSTWISSNGKYVTEFEQGFSAFMGSKHAISCCNGTVVLHLALLALGISEGDEVLVPSFTYIATANAVRYCGAVPVMVDCLEDTWDIDVADAERKITPKTKAIIPVHIYGNPCDMDSVMALAKTYGLKVVEDAAESHGALYDGKKVGTIGEIGTYSFFGNKIITTGEGGMVVTDDDSYNESIRLLKGQGQDPKRRYWFTDLGYNYRMTNIQAAIGLAQLECIDQHIQARTKVAEWYQENLSDMIGNQLTLQEITPKSKNVWWMFSVKLSENTKISRDLFMQRMEEKGVEMRPAFYPLHTMPVYKDLDAHCPVSEKISAQIVNLPTHALLKREDVDYVSDCIRQVLK